MDDMTIVVCASCRRTGDPEAAPRPGARLLTDTSRAARGSGIAVRRAGCLGNCGRGLTAAVYRAGCWSYVFGGLTPDSGADLVAGARLFAGATDGFMPYEERPQALRDGLVARIPNAGRLGDLPEAEDLP